MYLIIRGVGIVYRTRRQRRISVCDASASYPPRFQTYDASASALSQYTRPRHRIPVHEASVLYTERGLDVVSRYTRGLFVSCLVDCSVWFGMPTYHSDVLSFPTSGQQFDTLIEECIQLYRCIERGVVTSWRLSVVPIE